MPRRTSLVMNNGMVVLETEGESVVFPLEITTKDFRRAIDDHEFAASISNNRWMIESVDVDDVFRRIYRLNQSVSKLTFIFLGDFRKSGAMGSLKAFPYEELIKILPPLDSG